MSERINELVMLAVVRIDNLIIERGGRELGETSLHALHDMLTKLIRDAHEHEGQA